MAAMWGCGNAMIGAEIVERLPTAYSLPILVVAAIALGLTRRLHVKISWKRQLNMILAGLAGASLVAAFLGLAIGPNMLNLMLSLVLVPPTLLIARIIGGPARCVE